MMTAALLAAGGTRNRSDFPNPPLPCQRGFSLIPVLLLFASTLCGAQQSALDLNGRAVNPLQVSSGKVVVLIFVRRDCPISNRYAPTIQRLSSEHQNEVQFYLVFPDKSDSATEIRRYLD